MSEQTQDKALWNDDRILAEYKRTFYVDPNVYVWAFLCEMRDDYEQRLAELEAARAMPDDVSEIIITVLEDERDRHIINGGLAANRKEIETALAWLTSAQGRREYDDERHDATHTTV